MKKQILTGLFALVLTLGITTQTYAFSLSDITAKIAELKATVATLNQNLTGTALTSLTSVQKANLDTLTTQVQTLEKTITTQPEVVVSPVVSTQPVQPKLTFTSNLSVGMQGEDVKLLQQTLKDKGYFVGTVTGLFGPKTLEAVKTFQNINGITPTGYVGVRTIAGLGGQISTNNSVPRSGGFISETLNASPISQTSATLNGKLKFSITFPGGIPTNLKYWFQYGTNPTATGNNTTSTGQKPITNNAQDINVSESITGLQPGTTYYFKLCLGDGTTNFVDCGDPFNNSNVKSFVTVAQNNTNCQGAVNVSSGGAQIYPVAYNGSSGLFTHNFGQTTTVGTSPSNIHLPQIPFGDITLSAVGSSCGANLVEITVHVSGKNNNPMNSINQGELKNFQLWGYNQNSVINRTEIPLTGTTNLYNWVQNQITGEYSFDVKWVTNIYNPILNIPQSSVASVFLRGDIYGTAFPKNFDFQTKWINLKFVDVNGNLLQQNSSGLVYGPKLRFDNN